MLNTYKENSEGKLQSMSYLPVEPADVIVADTRDVWKNDDKRLWMHMIGVHY